MEDEETDLDRLRREAGFGRLRRLRLAPGERAPGLPFDGGAAVKAGDGTNEARLRTEGLPFDETTTKGD